MELIFAFFLPFVVAGIWTLLRSSSRGRGAPFADDDEAEDDNDGLPPGASKFYAGQRHRPPGQWVKAMPYVSVAGPQHRRNDVEVWAIACERAEQLNCPYGVALELEPGNAHDAHAIKVMGWAEFDSEHSWHLGYLPRSDAARIHREFIGAGVSLAAELISIYQGADGFIDIKVSVLRPRAPKSEKAA